MTPGTWDELPDAELRAQLAGVEAERRGLARELVRIEARRVELIERAGGADELRLALRAELIARGVPAPLPGS